jgi:hypothetical protein
MKAGLFVLAACPPLPGLSLTVLSLAKEKNPTVDWECCLRWTGARPSTNRGGTHPHYFPDRERGVGKRYPPLTERLS